MTLTITASSADHLNKHTNVAVLPCAAGDASREDKNLCDGLMEIVTRKLISFAPPSRIELANPLEVRANRVSSAEEAQDRLGAEWVLAPSLQRLREKPHITIALMRAAGASNHGRLLGSQDFPVDSRDIAGMEQAIAAWMGRMLGMPPPPAAQAAMPSEAKRLFFEGIILLQQYDNVDNIDKALVSFSGAVALAPAYAEAHAGQGEAYLRKYESTRHAEWIDVAKSVCERSLVLNHALAAGRRCLAMAYNTKGDYYKAIHELDAAINAEPTNDLTYRELAKAKERIGDLWGAEIALKQAISVREEYWAPYAEIGKFYAGRARYAEAANAYEQAIQRSRSNIQVRFSLSEVYAKTGRYEDAVRVLKESISYRPTHQAYSNLGNVFLRLRRFGEAAAEFEQARRLNPRAFTQIGNLARANYFLPGRREQSFAAYSEAVRLAEEQLARVNANDVNLHVMLAWYKTMLGKAPEAYDHLDLALAGQPPPEFYWIEAIVHNQFGDPERALFALEKAASEGFSKLEIQNTMEFDNLRDHPRFRAVVAQK